MLGKNVEKQTIIQEVTDCTTSPTILRASFFCGKTQNN